MQFNPAMRIESASLISTLAALAIAGGCSSSSDAADDIEDNDGKTEITVYARAAALVAFREGVDGLWQVATEVSPSEWEIAVSGPYVVSITCSDSYGAMTSQYANTLDDPREVYADCVGEESATTYNVSGTMMQAGELALGGGLYWGASSPWDFAIDVPAGTHDLIAQGQRRLAIRRALEVNADRTLEPIDLLTEGTLLVDAGLTATNPTAGEVLSSTVTLRTKPTDPSIELYRGEVQSTRVAPSAILVESDAQTITLTAVLALTPGVEFSRRVLRKFRVGEPAAFELPAAMGGATWEAAGKDLKASFTTLPAFDELFVYVQGDVDAPSAKRRSVFMTISAGFAAAMGVTSVVLDTEIPGFLPEWRADQVREQRRTVTASRTVSDGGSGYVTLRSSVTEIVPLPAP